MRALWRVSRHRDIEGFGGNRTNGRWHTKAEDKRIVYFAEHPALALVESLVNTRDEPGAFPRAYQLMKAASTDTVPVDVLPIETLSANWRDNFEETRFLGDSWLAGRRSALLGVPSAPSPESVNYLFNPLHPDAAGVSVEWCQWIEYDQRLFRVHEL